MPGRQHRRNSTPAARRRKRRYALSEKGKRTARAASARYYRSEKGMRARDRKNALARERRKAPATVFQELQGFRICKLKDLDRPSLYWMDQHGRLHKEEELSAQELIRRHQRKEKRKPCP